MYIVYKHSWDSDGQYDSIAYETKKVFKICMFKKTAKKLAKTPEYWNYAEGGQISFSYEGPFEFDFSKSK